MELEVEYEIFDETFDFIVQLLGTNAFRYFHPRTNSVINTSIIGSALYQFICFQKYGQTIFT